jgi:hypothetical protein
MLHVRALLFRHQSGRSAWILRHGCRRYKDNAQNRCPTKSRHISVPVRTKDSLWGWLVEGKIKRA